MAKFMPTCPICFQEDGYVIPLEKRGEIYICTRKPNEHKFVIGPDGYLTRMNGVRDGKENKT